MVRIKYFCLVNSKACLKQSAKDKQFGFIINVLPDKFILPFKTNSNETDFNLL